MKTFNDVSELVRFGGISDSCNKKVVYQIYDETGGCLITDIENLQKAERLAEGLVKFKNLTIIEKIISAYRICRTIEKL